MALDSSKRLGHMMRNYEVSLKKEGEFSSDAEQKKYNFRLNAAKRYNHSISEMKSYEWYQNMDKEYRKANLRPPKA